MQLDLNMWQANFPAVELLAVYGLTYIVAVSRAFKPVREKLTEINTWFGYLFECMACTGIWCAGVIYLLWYFELQWAIFILAGSASANFVHLFLKKHNP